MKVSAAIQILTTVMSGSANTDNWSAQHVHAGDVTARADLDLGACLDVETIDELSQNFYADADTQPQTAWVDDVIDMTSSNELTSSGEHASVVPNSEDISGGYLLGPGFSTTESYNYNFMDNLTTDNATFITLDALAPISPEPTSTYQNSVQDFGQFGSLSTAALTSTTTTSTIDMSSLEQFVMMDLDASTKQSQNSCSSSSNIPSTLWNLDLTTPASETTLSVSPGSRQDVKETLKNRLYSRGSLNSLSQDSDVVTLSMQSLSSSSSSLTQSFEEEDKEDVATILEKREKNRLAAQKCRTRKRDKTESLQKNVTRLEERQEKLKEEVQKLRDERESLEQIICVHGMVCPKMRKISNS